jgi:hypothetical protein
MHAKKFTDKLNQSSANALLSFITNGKLLNFISIHPIFTGESLHISKKYSFETRNILKLFSMDEKTLGL